LTQTSLAARSIFGLFFAAADWPIRPFGPTSPAYLARLPPPSSSSSGSRRHCRRPRWATADALLLESAKDRFIGVDPPGQHVPPHVRYGMVCLLIRELWVCILLESNGEWYAIPASRLVQEGP
jgi:hypothetical protein